MNRRYEISKGNKKYPFSLNKDELRSILVQKESQEHLTVDEAKWYLFFIQVVANVDNLALMDDQRYEKSLEYYLSAAEKLLLAGIHGDKLRLAEPSYLSERKQENALLINRLLVSFCSIVKQRLEKTWNKMDTPAKQNHDTIMSNMLITKEFVAYANDNKKWITCLESEIIRLQPDFTKTKRGQAGRQARIDNRNKLIKIAEMYLKNQIGRGCRCRHDKLAKITLENALFANVPLKDIEKKNLDLYGAIKDEAMKLLPNNRLFGTPKYDKTIKCPLSDHWK